MLGTHKGPVDIGLVSGPFPPTEEPFGGWTWQTCRSTLAVLFTRLFDRRIFIALIDHPSSERYKQREETKQSEQESAFLSLSLSLSPQVRLPGMVKLRTRLGAKNTTPYDVHVLHRPQTVFFWTTLGVDRVASFLFIPREVSFHPA